LAAECVIDSGRWLALEATRETWPDQGVIKGGTDLTLSMLTGIIVSRDEVQPRENFWGSGNGLGREAQLSEE